jgi:hypothetical protein
MLASTYIYARFYDIFMGHFTWFVVTCNDLYLMLHYDVVVLECWSVKHAQVASLATNLSPGLDSAALQPLLDELRHVFQACLRACHLIAVLGMSFQPPQMFHLPSSAHIA